jgi:hypothetical protein
MRSATCLLIVMTACGGPSADDSPADDSPTDDTADLVDDGDAEDADQPLEPDAWASRVTSVDVLVGPSSIHTYLELDGARNLVRFPDAGECADLSTDAHDSVPSCIDSITINGIELASPSASNSAMPYAAAVTLATDSILRITECGHPIEIPIHAGPFPLATDVVAVEEGDDLIIDWMTTESETLVGISGGTGQRACRVEGGHFRFSGFAGLPFLQAHVRPIAPPEEHATAIGPVRVWYGTETVVGDQQ